MPRFCALLAGINVGGNRTVDMEALVNLHEQLGHEDVSSYLRTGNVIFTSNREAESEAHL